LQEGERCDDRKYYGTRSAGGEGASFPALALLTNLISVVIKKNNSRTEREYYRNINLVSRYISDTSRDPGIKPADPGLKCLRPAVYETINARQLGRDFDEIVHYRKWHQSRSLERRFKQKTANEKIHENQLRNRSSRRSFEPYRPHQSFFFELRERSAVFIYRASYYRYINTARRKL